MNKAAEIIEEIKERERKGLSRRKEQREDLKKKSESIKANILEFAFHIQNSIKVSGDFKVLDEINKVLICGVGTNAIAGSLLRSYLKDSDLPIIVIRHHTLPPDVDSNTLVFILSHSGEEEEPMLCYRNALRKGCKIVGIMSGGKLAESFKRNEVDHIMIPSIIPENASLPYLFFPMLKVLDNSNLIEDQTPYINETISALKKAEYRDMAKLLADHCKGKVPLVCSSNKLFAVCRRWKNQFNRISKVHSFVSQYTDLCHNELDAFMSDSNIHVIILRDVDDDKHIVKSINVSKNIIKNRGYSVTEILIKGKNLLSKLLSAVYIGDWTSYYLAEIYDVDESSTDLVKKYREDLKNTI